MALTEILYPTLPRCYVGFEQYANIGSVPYTDLTSYMSLGYAALYWPAKSFNGANNWQLAWYSDRQYTVDPSRGGQAITLATFVDYDKSNKSNPVLIRIGNDTYLQYNRAKGFNSQQKLMIDQVTVVQQLSNGTNLLGGIDPTRPFLSISNFDKSGRRLVIYACSSGAGDGNNPDWMLISIGYDQSYCNLGKPPAPPTTPPVRSTLSPTALRPTSPVAKPHTSKPTFSAPIQPTVATVKAPASSAKPTIMPSKPASAPMVNRSSSCYDTVAMFNVTSYGKQGCLWLAARTSMQSALCPQQTVQRACPKTCKVCVSICADNTSGTFLDDISAKRNCLWLSLHKTGLYCSRAAVAALCPITCKTCS